MATRYFSECIPPLSQEAQLAFRRVHQHDCDVVFLHGLLGHSNTWRSVVQSLRSKLPFAGTWLYDFRNHGHSCHTATHTLADLTGDVTTLLDTEELARPSKRVVLVGHSMGSLTATSVLLSRPHRQHNIVGFVSLDMPPLCREDAPSNLVNFLQQTLEAMQRTVLTDVVDMRSASSAIQNANYPTDFDPNLKTFLLTNIALDKKNPHAIARWRCNVDVLANCLGDIFLPPKIIATNKIHVPVLAVMGSESPLLACLSNSSSSPSARYVDLWSRVVSAQDLLQFRVVQKARHNPHFDAMEEVVEMVSSFCSAAFERPLSNR